MAKDDQRQLDGSTVETENSDEPDLDDFGEERPYWKSNGGFRRDLLSSVAQKGTRRSDVEVTEFAVWEMVRSGFGSNAWNRLMLYLVEDIAAGEPVVLMVPELERIARDDGVDSHVSQVAAIKAARLCADAWSSREAVHYDDYLRHVAKLRVECDEPPYEFPIQPDSRHEARPPTGGQMTFVDDGDLEPDVPTNDYGEELREGETYGGFDYERLLTVLNEAIVDEDIELAGFAAWDLVRSGYHEEYWKRIAEIGALYAPADSLVSPLLAQYEELATDRWDPDEWEGRISAIHAAITVIREGTTTETVEQCGEFHKLAEQRVDGDAKFPVEPEELDVGERYCVAADKHTRPGGWADRDWKHFWFRACRCAQPGEPSHSRRWQRERLLMEREYFRNKFTHATEEEIEHALTPVSEDEPWEEDRVAPDAELGDFDCGGEERE